MKTKFWLALVVNAAFLGVPWAAAQAHPKFVPYIGKDSIHEGQGGEREIIDGVDFWSDGAPPRRFEVLGVITDRRRETGLIGAIRMHSLDPDIAKLARQEGGDGVILMGNRDEVIGVSGFGNAYAWGGHGWASGFGSSFSRPVKELDSKYAVVKYLLDQPAEPASSTPETGSATPAASSPAAAPTPPSATPPVSTKPKDDG